MSDVFVSYKKQDRLAAELIASALAREGWSVWWDRELYGGAAFAQVIAEQLDGARAVVVLWSHLSISSNWVIDEASRAGQRIVPVLIEHVRPPLPYGSLHTFDLSGWKGDTTEAEYVSLHRTLSRLISSPAPSLGPVQASILLPRPARRTSLWLGFSALAALLGMTWLVTWGREAGSTAVAREPSQSESASARAGLEAPPSSVSDDSPMNDPAPHQVLELLRVAEAHASSERMNDTVPHPAAAAFDGNRETAWNSMSSSAERDEWLEATLEETAWISHLEVATGYQHVTRSGLDLFYANARPKTLELQIDGRKAASLPVDKNQRDLSVPVKANGRSLKLVVREVWPATDSRVGRFGDVCVSEVLVYGLARTEASRPASGNGNLEH